MKYAIGPRREMAVRTVFNILGPLTNPAGARRQLMGVFREDLTDKLGRVLQKLGAERALVVHGHDGLDEISVTAETTLTDVTPEKVETRRVAPEDMELGRWSLEELVVSDAEEAAGAMRAVLAGEEGARRDVVLANAGAAAVVAGKAADLREGARLAAASIDEWKAAAALERLVEISNSAASEP